MRLIRGLIDIIVAVWTLWGDDRHPDDIERHGG